MLARDPIPGPFCRPHARRKGAAIVESALVLSVFLMLLFGMFEYCRFLLVLHITNNAARDGARYASVNVDKPSTFVNTDFTDASGKVFKSVTAYTKARMGGVDKNISNMKIGVYSVDQAGLDLTPPIIRPKTKDTGGSPKYPDPFDPNDALAYPWNSAPFPARLAVTINGDYHPIAPSLLMMPTTIKINISSILSGEG